MIDAGQPAPDFTLPDQDGNPVSLTDFKGRTIVVYFYPKADTPGCTTQACGIRDNAAAYAEAGVTVLGISPDPVAKVKTFHAGQSLTFTLLADEDHAVCDAFGTWVEKSMYGNTYMGAARATFIVGGDGTILRAFPKVQPKQHDQLVLKALGELTEAT